MLLAGKKKNVTVFIKKKNLVLMMTFNDSTDETDLYLNNTKLGSYIFGLK